MGITITGKVTFGYYVPPATPITYAKWNPLDKGPSITLSNFDLTESSSDIGLVRSNIIVSGSKRYWEHRITVAATSHMQIGIDTGATSVNNYVGSSLSSYSWWGTDFYNNGSAFLSIGSSFGLNDVVGIALDLIGNTIQFYLNDTAAGPAINIAAGNYYAAAGADALGVGRLTANFGDTAFLYPSNGTGFISGIY